MEVGALHVASVMRLRYWAEQHITCKQLPTLLLPACHSVSFMSFSVYCGHSMVHAYSMSTQKLVLLLFSLFMSVYVVAGSHLLS
jgi:hypothetical protein